MSGNINDENLRKEILRLIEDTRNQIPTKSETKQAIMAKSFIVFALGCLTGIEMYTINLFLTSNIEISLMLLLFFFGIGFLIGVFVEKTDILKVKSKYGNLDY